MTPTAISRFRLWPCTGSCLRRYLVDNSVLFDNFSGAESFECPASRDINFKHCDAATYAQTGRTSQSSRNVLLASEHSGKQESKLQASRGIRTKSYTDRLCKRRIPCTSPDPDWQNEYRKYDEFNHPSRRSSTDKRDQM